MIEKFGAIILALCGIALIFLGILVWFITIPIIACIVLDMCCFLLLMLAIWGILLVLEID